MKQDLSDAIEDYARWRKSQDFSKATLRADGIVLRRFLSINGNVGVWQISDRHVQRHFEDAAKTRQASTLRNDHTVLHGFFKWCRHTRRMAADCDPMFGRRGPKVRRRERNRIHMSDFPRLLDVAGERSPRDRAVVAVLMYTLVRDSEARTVRLRDVDLQGGWLKVTVHKTGVEDTLPISSELDSELRRWLTAYTENVGPLEPHYHLLPARAVLPQKDDSGRFTHHDVRYLPEKPLRASGTVVSPALEAFGFPLRDENGESLGEGAHTIRRSGARALFDQLTETGYDHGLRIVQSMLHHKSMAMTEHYLGISADRRSRDDIIRGKVMYRTSKDKLLHLAR